MTSRGFVKLDIPALGGVTLGYNVTPEAYPVGQQARFAVWGVSYTPRAIALAVALPSALPRAINTLPHLTLAWPKDSAPIQGKYALVFGHTIILPEPLILEGKIKFYPFQK